jgi:hypothetical protein
MAEKDASCGSICYLRLVSFAQRVILVFSVRRTPTLDVVVR